MKLPRLADHLFEVLLDRVVMARPADFIVGADSPAGAYLLRWYLTPWRRLQTRWRARAERHPNLRNRIVAKALNLLPNLYLHHFERDDDDRALHDHPSWAVSFMLQGRYIEHTIDAGGIHRRRLFVAGALRFLPTRHAHRIELPRINGRPQPCWTLFLFGPTVRDWGFHCPEKGWVPWQEFTAAGKPGEIGPGCGE
jgi:hypothetical protein